uniref:Uncharacterized protein n=1 Tax=Vespula pensylvanica TaxID=30213 RepID=A0A834N779_VESPE|nr:hypothetical protein H0235_016308 [Vespula pensylvanica]
MVLHDDIKIRALNDKLYLQHLDQFTLIRKRIRTISTIRIANIDKNSTTMFTDQQIICTVKNFQYLHRGYFTLHTDYQPSVQMFSLSKELPTYTAMKMHVINASLKVTQSASLQRI